MIAWWGVDVDMIQYAVELESSRQFFFYYYIINKNSLLSPFTLLSEINYDYLCWSLRSRQNILCRSAVFLVRPYTMVCTPHTLVLVLTILHERKEYIYIFSAKLFSYLFCLFPTKKDHQRQDFFCDLVVVVVGWLLLLLSLYHILLSLLCMYMYVYNMFY